QPEAQRAVRRGARDRARLCPDLDRTPHRAVPAVRRVRDLGLPALAVAAAAAHAAAAAPGALTLLRQGAKLAIFRAMRVDLVLHPSLGSLLLAGLLLRLAR